MAKPIFMHQIKQIIEHRQQGRGIKEIARLTGFSRNTVKVYLKRARESGLTEEQLLGMEEGSLEPIMYSHAMGEDPTGRKADPRYEAFSKNLAHYVHELGRRGVTRQLLWEEYRKENPQGYGRSQFCEYLRSYCKKDKAVMHFTHRAGEQMQVDFAGDKMSYVDITTGEEKVCEVLVCVLPYSNYMYVEALGSQRQEDFINGLTNALTHFGGVPLSIKCDNMKTAVVRAHRYAPQFTEVMEQVEKHYDTSALAARVRKPRDKGSVEKGVDLTYKKIYAPLRDEVFYSLAELNAAMHKQLALFHACKFQNKIGTRQEWFDREEKPVLKNLPATRFEIKHVTQGKVQRNYHVILGEDRHQYSVPYTLIGKDLKLHYTAKVVEIYHGLKRVAIHSRSRLKNGYTTLTEHMPVRHQHAAQERSRNAEHFLHQASCLGQGVEQVVKKILESKAFYERTYNHCNGLLHLGKQYGNDRLEAACQRALTLPDIAYDVVANILKNQLDKMTPTPTLPIPQHEQIRGPQFYQ